MGEDKKDMSTVEYYKGFVTSSLEDAYTQRPGQEVDMVGPTVRFVGKATVAPSALNKASAVHGALCKPAWTKWHLWHKSDSISSQLIISLSLFLHLFFQTDLKLFLNCYIRVINAY
eukprot:g1804.t1